MITPPGLRSVSREDAPSPASVPDMRTWWGRNAAAVGVIVGTAMTTVLAGTGGLTGLAHVVGIATVKETAALKEEIVGVVKMHQAAANADETRFVEINTKLDAMARDAKAFRVDILKRTKKRGASE